MRSLEEEPHSIEETGYDIWNGGTYSVTLYVQVAPETSTLLGPRRPQVEEEITEFSSSSCQPT
jgi:hypothetical protein